MPALKKKASSKEAPLPKGVKAEDEKKKSKKLPTKLRKYQHLFSAQPRIYAINRSIQHKRDLTRFVKWPKYIRLQRQKVVLMKRLKIPPSINQFTNTLDKPNAASLFAFLDKHKPETPSKKKERLMEEAKVLAETGERPKTPKPIEIKCGLDHVTALIEAKKAKLVVIAHDVDPIELVLWMPALCVKMGVPYCIVKGKSRLGQLVGMKTATAVCLCEAKPGLENEFTAICNLMTSKFNDKYDGVRRQWGGSTLGKKSKDALEKKKARGIEVQQ